MSFSEAGLAPIGQIGMYEQSTDVGLGTRLGFGYETHDGRTFRFGRTGAANVGELMATAAVVANHRVLTAVAAAIGAVDITQTLGATLATSNQYSQGNWHCVRGPGLGQTRKIRHHPAAALSANLRVTLMDALTIALTTASRITLRQNRFADIVCMPTAATRDPVGIAQVTVTVASSYCWFQTRGFGLVLAEAALTVGQPFTMGSATCGAVRVIAAHAEAQLGVANDTTAAADHCPANIMLE